MRFKSKASAHTGGRKISFKQRSAVRHGCPGQQGCHMESVRHSLAVVVVCSVVAVGLLAAFVPRADEILSKLLPALMLILAYYFGRRR